MPPKQKKRPPRIYATKEKGKRRYYIRDSKKRLLFPESMTQDKISKVVQKKYLSNVKRTIREPLKQTYRETRYKPFPTGYILTQRVEQPKPIKTDPALKNMLEDITQQIDIINADNNRIIGAVNAISAQREAPKPVVQPPQDNEPAPQVAEPIEAKQPIEPEQKQPEQKQPEQKQPEQKQPIEPEQKEQLPAGLTEEDIQNVIDKIKRDPKFKVIDLQQIVRHLGGDSAIPAGIGVDQKSVLIRRMLTIRPDLVELIRPIYTVSHIKNRIKEHLGMYEGSGVLEGGLSNIEIDDIMKKYSSFVGTYASDEIDQVEPYAERMEKLGFILNTDTSDGPGEHWVAVYIDSTGDKEINYYDSLADPPTEDFMTRIKAVIDKMDLPYYLKFKVNKIKDQRSDTNTCGLHAMRFLIDRFNGKPFREASGFNNTQRAEGEVLEKFNYI